MKKESNNSKNVAEGTQAAQNSSSTVAPEEEEEVDDLMMVSKIVETRLAFLPPARPESKGESNANLAEDAIMQKGCLTMAVALPTNKDCHADRHNDGNDASTKEGKCSESPAPPQLERNHNNSAGGYNSLGIPGAFPVYHPDAMAAAAAAASDGANTAVHNDERLLVPTNEEDTLPRAGETGRSPFEALSVPLDATVVADDDDEEACSRPSKPKESSAKESTTKRSSDNCETSLTLEATPYKEEEQPASGTTKLIAIVGILLIVIVLLSLGLSGVFGNRQGSGPASVIIPATPIVSSTQTSPNDTAAVQEHKPTLQMIREEGVLKCGYLHLPAVANGAYENFLGVLCEAIAAAIFGLQSNYSISQTLPGTNTTIRRTVPVEFVANTKQGPFDTLLQKKIHLNTFGFTHNMGRHVYHPPTQSAYQFSIPYLYEGMRLAGDPFYVQCAENNLHHLNDCQGLRICVGEGSTYHTTLEDIIPRRNIVVMPRIGTNQGLIDGTCNVMAGSSFMMATNQTIHEAGYTGDYLFSDNYFSKEPVAIVTRPDDAQWSDFVNSVLMALLVAEQQNITQDNAYVMFPQTNLFGEDYKDMFRNAVGYAGNFGEIYQRFLQHKVPRTTLNWINNGTTGLMYSHPFGGAIDEDRGDGTPLSEKMTNILTAGVIRCGIRVLDRPGFATKDATTDGSYSGMEVDYCKMLSASLFEGSTANVEYVELIDQKAGFQKLATGEIDVFAGTTWTLANDIKEPNTGMGFAFTRPYFYGYSSEEDNLALATLEDDHDWKTFVYWAVMATIYAEEEGIGSAQSNDMPEVFLYGSGLKRMFRDGILAVGNYGDIYQRTLQIHIPRAGRNLLNANPKLGAQHYLIPGFLPSQR